MALNTRTAHAQNQSYRLCWVQLIHINYRVKNIRHFDRPINLFRLDFAKKKTEIRQQAVNLRQQTPDGQQP